MAPNPKWGSVSVPLGGCSPEASPTLSPAIRGVRTFPEEPLSCCTPSACREAGGQQHNSTESKEHQEVRDWPKVTASDGQERGEGAWEAISNQPPLLTDRGLSLALEGSQAGHASR